MTKKHTMRRGPFDLNYSEEKKKLWQDQEDRAAKLLKGRRTPRSGGMPFGKGDVKAKDFLCEAKETGKTSMSIKLAWLEKIAGEALPLGKSPAVHLCFSAATDLCEMDWMMVPASVFGEMYERAYHKGSRK